MKKVNKVLSGLLAGAMCFSMMPYNVLADDAEESVYRTLYSSEVGTLNYLITGSTNDYAISANIVDCLVDYDSYGNITPGLAESWESNDDMTEWTFHIRQGVKWVNNEGEEMADVTAQDWVTAAVYVNDAINESSSQYMYDTGAVVHNAQAYYEYTAYMLASDDGELTEDEEGNPIEVVDEVDPESIGVEAVDDYTLVYHLDQPCSFFPTVLSYTSYMPVSQECLDEYGYDFALDNESMWYNGAYVLDTYEPQEKRVLKKNENYWDAENVHLTEIEAIYNADASSVEASMYKKGEIDNASISADLLDSWLSDDETKDEVHGSRANNSFSYFYSFNFDPQFDEEYEPENWKIAVNNVNFRKALMAALDRVKALSIYEPYNPENVVNNTITPADFNSAGGLDYTQFDTLKAITEGDSFDEAAAVEFRDAAKAELEEAGATFPIKVLMPYNPSSTNWDKECQIVEQQMEAVLGTDFIDIVLEAGPETGFLSAVRRCGNYAFMKCNWGADYADPSTWAEPFKAGNNYNFWDKSEDEETQAIFTQWAELEAEAEATYDDETKRYELFAEAEKLLIDNAIVVPFSISVDSGYLVSKLNPMEGEYAPYGVALQRYKFQTLQDKSMSMDEFQAALEQWKLDRAASLGEAEAVEATTEATTEG